MCKWYNNTAYTFFYEIKTKEKSTTKWDESIGSCVSAD